MRGDKRDCSLLEATRLRRRLSAIRQHRRNCGSRSFSEWHRERKVFFFRRCLRLILLLFSLFLFTLLSQIEILGRLSRAPSRAPSISDDLELRISELDCPFSLGFSPPTLRDVAGENGARYEGGEEEKERNKERRKPQKKSFHHFRAGDPPKKRDWNVIFTSTKFFHFFLLHGLYSSNYR